jgi:hypothetical protein
MSFSTDCLSLTLPIFQESFLLAPGLFPENEKISALPPSGFLMGIYLFYESWSTETLRKKESKKWAVCSIYLSLCGQVRGTDDLQLPVNADVL